MSRSLDTDVATLEAAIAAFLAAFNDLDWQRFRALFTDDATVFFPRLRAERATTLAEVEETWHAIFAGIRTGSGRTAPPYQDLHPRDRHIQWLGDVALLTFHLGGPETLGRRTLVWRRTAAGWRIAHLHASTAHLP